MTDIQNNIQIFWKKYNKITSKDSLEECILVNLISLRSFWDVFVLVPCISNTELDRHWYQTFEFNLDAFTLIEDSSKQCLADSGADLKVIPAWLWLGADNDLHQGFLWNEATDVRGGGVAGNLGWAQIFWIFLWTTLMSNQQVIFLLVNIYTSLYHGESHQTRLLLFLYALTQE